MLLPHFPSSVAGDVADRLVGTGNLTEHAQPGNPSAYVVFCQVLSAMLDRSSNLLAEQVEHHSLEMAIEWLFQHPETELIVDEPEAAASPPSQETPPEGFFRPEIQPAVSDVPQAVPDSSPGAASSSANTDVNLSSLST